MTDASKIVVSTRIRLARNVEGYPFPSHLKNEKQAKDVIRLVTSGLARLDEFKIYYMDNLSEAEALSLKENHLISPNIITKRGAAALINREESVSIMINEEDHLREQCIVKGLDLQLAYETMSEIDGRISRSMKFAYDEQLGFLTACPTNLGTGLRASVMLFLPALTINGLMPRVIKAVARLGLTVRGIYGEGSRAEGYIYQISNEVTLGVTEEEIIQQVEETVKKVCDLETAEREGRVFKVVRHTHQLRQAFHRGTRQVRGGRKTRGVSRVYQTRRRDANRRIARKNASVKRKRRIGQGVDAYRTRRLPRSIRGQVFKKNSRKQVDLTFFRPFNPIL